jgi:DNA-binding NtrC family response regulator
MAEFGKAGEPGSCIFGVDDEAAIASSLAAILQMKGFSAKFFTCPLAALAAAGSETPDLVIFGRRDAAISGVDLAIQIRAQHPNCKILLFSGQAANLDLLKGARVKVLTSAYSRSPFILLTFSRR